MRTRRDGRARGSGGRGLGPLAVALVVSAAVAFGAGLAPRTSTAAVGATREATLVASDAAPGDLFGTSVAVSGSTAVGGALGKSSQAGVAYVYVRSGSVWTQQAELRASDQAPYRGFGASVAVSGDTVVVGDVGTHGDWPGEAYVFVRSGSVWTQQAKLTAPDSPGCFGCSVAVSGSVALVGAAGTTAYLFVREGTTLWRRTKLLGGGDPTVGTPVALAAGTAVIGSVETAYVFGPAAAAWTQQAQLFSSSPGPDSFGYDVAISADTAAVSNYLDAVFVYVRSGSTWSKQAQLGSVRAFRLAVSGDTLVAAAFPNDALEADVFVRSGTAWAEREAIPIGASSHFGASVALDDGTMVVGAPGRKQTGLAYVYAL